MSGVGPKSRAKSGKVNSKFWCGDYTELIVKNKASVDLAVRKWIGLGPHASSPYGVRTPSKNLQKNISFKTGRRRIQHLISQLFDAKLCFFFDTVFLFFLVAMEPRASALAVVLLRLRAESCWGHTEVFFEDAGHHIHAAEAGARCDLLDREVLIHQHHARCVDA